MKGIIKKNPLVIQTNDQGPTQKRQNGKPTLSIQNRFQFLKNHTAWELNYVLSLLPVTNRLSAVISNGLKNMLRKIKK